MHYKNSTKKLPEIAEELGVDYLVEGSVARDGNSVRLQARLVRPNPEQQIWADAYDRSIASAIAMHEAMAVSIARAAGGAIESTNKGEVATQAAVEPAVYELYLQGRYWAGKFGREELTAARAYFEKAIALNPRFAPAWAGLADTLAMTGLFYSDASEQLNEAETAAKRAMSLDPDSAQALGTLSDIAGARWEWQLAEDYVLRAIEIDPSSSQAYRRYWLLLAPQRRFEEARIAIEQARKLDPLSAQTTANLGLQELFEDRVAEAEKVLLSALSLDPDYRLVHAYLWVVYSRLERDPDRGRELIKYLSAVGYSDDVADLEELIELEGYPKALRKLALSLDSKYSDEPDRLGVIAGLLAESGETDRALAWLRAGVSRRAWSLGWLPVAPDLRKLRDRPEFQELIRELGLEPSSK
jgi:tetratricopeptide (TPR) repeat protein